MNTVDTNQTYKVAPIPDYPGYLVTSEGQVFSDKNTSGRKVLAERTSDTGERTVRLSSNGTRKSYRVARLVACAFVPNPYHYPAVGHLNGMLWDNREQNLYWGPKSAVEARIDAPNTYFELFSVRTGKLYQSVSEAAADLNVSCKQIRAALKKADAPSLQMIKRIAPEKQKHGLARLLQLFTKR